MGYNLAGFITNVDDLVRNGSHFSRIVSFLEPLLTVPNLLDRRELILPPGRPNIDYCLHLAQDESWCIEAFVWKRGAMTPIHDHLTWAVVGQYIGQELEVRYRLLNGKLIETGRTQSNPGEVTTLTPPDDIHQVRNVFPGTSVSIHVYGTNMAKQLRHEYNSETGQITIDRRRRFDV